MKIKKYPLPIDVECPYCLVTLEIVYEDVKDYKVHCDYLGDCDTVRGIECIRCKNVFPYTFGKRIKQLFG